jgi:hypothetical protein
LLLGLNDSINTTPCIGRNGAICAAEGNGGDA